MGEPRRGNGDVGTGHLVLPELEFCLFWHRACGISLLSDVSRQGSGFFPDSLCLLMN